MLKESRAGGSLYSVPSLLPSSQHLLRRQTVNSETATEGIHTSYCPCSIIGLGKGTETNAAKVYQWSRRRGLLCQCASQGGLDCLAYLAVVSREVEVCSSEERGDDYGRQGSEMKWRKGMMMKQWVRVGSED